MALFDKVKEVGAKGLDKAKDLGDIGKNKLKIAEQESDMKKIMEDIIKDILTNKPEFLQENYPEQFAKINEIKETIEKFKDTIEEIKKD